MYPNEINGSKTITHQEKDPQQSCIGEQRKTAWSGGKIAKRCRHSGMAVDGISVNLQHWAMTITPHFLEAKHNPKREKHTEKPQSRDLTTPPNPTPPGDPPGFPAFLQWDSEIGPGPRWRNVASAAVLPASKPPSPPNTGSPALNNGRMVKAGWSSMNQEKGGGLDGETNGQNETSLSCKTWKSWEEGGRTTHTPECFTTLSMANRPIKWASDSQQNI